MKTIIGKFVDIAVLSSFIIGSVYSIPFLLNASLFVYWFVAIMIFFVLVFNDDNELFKDTDDFYWYGFVFSIFTDIILAGFGHFVLAGISMFVDIVYYGRRYQYFRK